MMQIVIFCEDVKSIGFQLSGRLAPGCNLGRKHTWLRRRWLSESAECHLNRSDFGDWYHESESIRKLGCENQMFAGDAQGSVANSVGVSHVELEFSIERFRGQGRLSCFEAIAGAGIPMAESVVQALVQIS